MTALNCVLMYLVGGLFDAIVRNNSPTALRKAEKA
jgi:hypothetical protein